MDPVTSTSLSPQQATGPDTVTQTSQCTASREFCEKLRERHQRGDSRPVTSSEVRSIAERHHAPKGAGGQEDYRDAALEAHTGEEKGRRCRALGRILERAKDRGLISEEQKEQIEHLSDSKKRLEICRELAQKNDIAHNSDEMLKDATQLGLITQNDANRLRKEIHQQLNSETKAFLVAEGLIQKSFEKEENISSSLQADLSKLSTSDQAAVLRQPTLEQKLALLDRLVSEYEAKKGLPKSPGQTLG